MRPWTLHRKVVLCCLISFVIGFYGCANSYYYLPEVNRLVASPGKKGDVVFQIPATGPTELILRVRALGIEEEEMARFLVIEMSFERPRGGVRSPEYLRPDEQVVRIGDEQELHAGEDRGGSEEKRIDLTGLEREVLKFRFPIPGLGGGADQIPGYTFQWRVHYGKNREETQTVRFDRFDSTPRKVGGLDTEGSDLPFYVSPIQYPGSHVMTFPYWWWAVDPWWPWWR